MNPEKVHYEWVARVLGVTVPVRAGARSDIKVAAARWREASETVDAQLSQLQQALRASDDEELREIGEYGINAVTGNFRVPLMAALLGAEQGNPQDVGKLAGAIAKFRKHLETDERIEACDDNPLGVTVTLRQTLIPALDALVASL